MPLCDACIRNKQQNVLFKCDEIEFIGVYGGFEGENNFKLQDLLPFLNDVVKRSEIKDYCELCDSGAEVGVYVEWIILTSDGKLNAFENHVDIDDDDYKAIEIRIYRCFNCGNWAIDLVIQN